MDFKATFTLKRKRKKVVNDRDAPEASLNARDKFLISTFYIIIYNHKAEMSRRGQVYNGIADMFSCLVNVPDTLFANEIVQYSECCEELINTYPEESNSNLFTELQKFHSNIRYKISATKSGNIGFCHAELYKVMVKVNMECAFPNVEISLHIFLTLMVTNCSAECPFSQLKRIRNPNRTTMRQEKLDSLSLLMIEADLWRKINFDDMIKDFARHKSRYNNFRM